ncbi:MAG: peptidoglycan DD-metalloendopeptidase family protein [Caldilineaceae bacterium]|nr:peptidoglycan DD-metalloendopeptidase family protein [Caldilineaceae bacterium]
MIAWSLLLAILWSAGCGNRAQPTATPPPTATSPLVGGEPQVITLPPPAATASSTPLPPPAPPTPIATPQRVVHAVAEGETLIAIALEYNVTIEALLRANDLLDPDLLRIGQKIVVPLDGDLPATGASPTATSAVHMTTAELPGMRFACPATAEQKPVLLPAEAIQLLVANGILYLVADGQLYGLPLDAVLAESDVRPARLTPADGRIGDLLLEELVYATVDEATGDLLLLDKSNDIYRYTRDGLWQVEIKAQAIPGQFPDPQYLALAYFKHELYVLDADLSHIWRFASGATLPDAYFTGGEILDGVDMTVVTRGDAQGTLHVLTRAGKVVTIPPGGNGRTISEPALPVTWPAQIRMFGEAAIIVDGDSRTLTQLGAQTGDDGLATGMRFPDLRRVRSVARAGDWLLAIAGDRLITFNLMGEQTPDETLRACPPVTVNDQLIFHSQNLENLLADFSLPFTAADLPDRPRSYPGARRLYRFGIHTGVDLYPMDAEGLAIGSSVLAIADGAVLRIDHDYQSLTPGEFDALVDQTEAIHRTTPELFERFMGRQVQLDHGDAIRSIYGHLDSVNPALAPGDLLLRGAPIGTVGVTGTSAGAYGYTDGVHLHYEIWVGDRYLGQGLSLYETMRIWQAIFQ